GRVRTGSAHLCAGQLCRGNCATLARYATAVVLVADVAARDRRRVPVGRMAAAQRRAARTHGASQAAAAPALGRPARGGVAGSGGHANAAGAIAFRAHATAGTGLRTDGCGQPAAVPSLPVRPVACQRIRGGQAAALDRPGGAHGAEQLRVAVAAVRQLVPRLWTGAVGTGAARLATGA